MFDTVNANSVTRNQLNAILAAARILSRNLDTNENHGKLAVLDFIDVVFPASFRRRFWPGSFTVDSISLFYICFLGYVSCLSFDFGTKVLDAIIIIYGEGEKRDLEISRAFLLALSQNFPSILKQPDGDKLITLSLHEFASVEEQEVAFRLVAHVFGKLNVDSKLHVIVRSIAKRQLQSMYAFLKVMLLLVTGFKSRRQEQDCDNKQGLVLGKIVGGEEQIRVVKLNVIHLLADISVAVKKPEVADTIIPFFIKCLEEGDDASTPRSMRLQLLDVVSRIATLGFEKSYRETVVLMTRGYLSKISTIGYVESKTPEPQSRIEHVEIVVAGFLTVATGLMNITLRADYRHQLLSLCSDVSLASQSRSLLGSLLPAVAEICSDFDPTSNVEPSLRRLFHNLWFYIARFGLTPPVLKPQSPKVNTTPNSMNTQCALAVQGISQGTPPLVINYVNWLEDELELIALHNSYISRGTQNKKVASTHRTALSGWPMKAIYLHAVALLEMTRFISNGGILNGGCCSRVCASRSAFNCVFEYLKSPNLTPDVSQCLTAIVYRAFEAAVSWLDKLCKANTLQLIQTTTDVVSLLTEIKIGTGTNEMCHGLKTSSIPAVMAAATTTSGGIPRTWRLVSIKQISRGFLVYCASFVGVQLIMLTVDAMETGVFIWTWLVCAAPQLGSLVLAEIIDAWIWTVDAKRGLFASDARYHGPAEILRPQLSPGKPEDPPYSDPVVVQILAHRLWLGLLVDRFEVRIHGILNYA
ncbi:unnamed protein product [Cochlearia groenlandica]